MIASATHPLVDADPDAAPTVLESQRCYLEWLTRRAPTGADLYRQRVRARQMRQRPLVSLVVPVYNTMPEMLRRLLTCVTRQTYQHWELCLVDDGSSSRWIERLLSRMAASDRRIRFHRRPERGGISAATNDGLRLATGDIVTFADHDDEIDPRLLFLIVEHFNQHPDAAALHFDLDYLHPPGIRRRPLLMPGWSPELLLSSPYIVHVALRKECLRQVGELRSHYDGAQDYDFALRLCEVTEPQHIPEVLYHWRVWAGSASSGGAAKPYAFDARKRAVEEALRRRGLAGRCVDHTMADLHRVIFDIAGAPLVSVIVPTAGDASVDEAAARVERLAARTAYRRFELLVAGAPGTAAAVAARLAGPEGGVRAVPCDSGDLAAMVNRAAAAARGDHLLIVSPDLEPIDEEWMSSLLEYSQQAAIGVVGAQIYRPDGAVWHAGVQIPRGSPVTIRQDILLNPSEYREALHVANMSAVGGGCLMTRRDVFDQVGGFHTRDEAGFVDVDYCLRVRARGRRVVFTPFSRLRIAAPRPMFPGDGLPAFRQRWSGFVDPYYNPNLSPDGRFLLNLE